MFGAMPQTILALALVLAAVQAPAPRADVPPPGTTITVAELAARHALGKVLVLDVRSTASFEAGHIAGAIGVPLDQIERRAADIRKQSRGRPVVTYCSCPTEHASLAAADMLRTRGLTVHALVGGYPAWLAAGGATERKSRGGTSARRF
jgi:rhodanese-related sulfurtransferase